MVTASETAATAREVEKCLPTMVSTSPRSAACAESTRCASRCRPRARCPSRRRPRGSRVGRWSLPAARTPRTPPPSWPLEGAKGRQHPDAVAVGDCRLEHRLVGFEHSGMSVSAARRSIAGPKAEQVMSTRRRGMRRSAPGPRIGRSSPALAWGRGNGWTLRLSSSRFHQRPRARATRALSAPVPSPPEWRAARRCVCFGSCRGSPQIATRPVAVGAAGLG